jgi:hypothetical protein
MRSDQNNGVPMACSVDYNATEIRNMSADMTLQTASGNTHEGEERAVSIKARRSTHAQLNTKGLV